MSCFRFSECDIIPSFRSSWKAQFKENLKTKQKTLQHSSWKQRKKINMKWHPGEGWSNLTKQKKRDTTGKASLVLLNEWGHLSASLRIFQWSYCFNCVKRSELEHYEVKVQKNRLNTCWQGQKARGSNLPKLGRKVKTKLETISTK